MGSEINKADLFLGYFEKLDTTKPQTEKIELYSKIYSKTNKISSYFESSVKKFPSLFDKNLETFEECLNYLEKISIPNKCVCAGVISDIPGWRCIDCSKNENTIYCSDCYIKSKDLHKGHKVYYWENSSGMCDCGDPSALNQYCHEHSGPFNNQNDIDNYIEKSFGKKVVENLTNFFDDFFLKFSKYLILTEKCEFFMPEFFLEKYDGDLSEDLEKEKKSIKLIKYNFGIVFKNFIYFLRLISKNNLGMVYLLSNYFLKNNFCSSKIEKEYKTEHSCIEINKNDIKVFYDSEEDDGIHVCKCPFLRLFMSNYRDNVRLNSTEDEQQFIFSFVHNLELRKSFCIIYFFIYNQILYNYNKELIVSRTQFFLKDSIDLITEKTNFLESSVKVLYKCFIKFCNQIQNKDIEPKKKEGLLKTNFYYLTYFSNEIKYYPLMTEKIEFFKVYIDIACLFHNIYGYKSIEPHPPFQEKEFYNYLNDIENMLEVIPGLLNCLLEWNKIDKLKEINKYLIYKILNQKKEKIRQLEEKEFTFHINLYRFFGIFLNTFCFNYSFNNNCTIMESINYYKKNFFDSQEQIENLIDIILNDYCKYFGFICGCHNNFFNYYDRVNDYFKLYINFNLYQSDINLMKYIFVLSEKDISINSYLKLSNIENVYSKFDNIFNQGNNIEINKEKDKIITKESIKGDDNIYIDDNSEIQEEILDDISPLAPIDILLANSFNNRNRRINDKNQDEYNIIMQWKMLLEFPIYIMRDNSCCYWSLINNYEKMIDSDKKINLYNQIKNNKFAMEDLKNILKEKIILNLIENGNLINIKQLEKNLDSYLLTIFEENNTYDEILDKLTYNKMFNETKLFYLKDEHLKLFDLNYIINPKDKSNAEKYILDFKKDVIKTYNCHFVNHSELTFDFFHKVYEKIFLNKNNLELIIKIIETLVNNDKNLEKLDRKSIGNNLLPVVLNYLQIFNMINTKSFIEFKFQNQNIINKLHELLSNIIQNNEKTNLIDKDLENQIKEIQNQINRYKLISDLYNNDLSKLNKYDYNSTIINENDININKTNSDIITNQKQKMKNTKEKLKSLMKNKKNNFLKKIESNEEMIKAINDNTNIEENNKNNEEEIICFYCRNSIKLNTFEEPYGKLGLYINDNFYVNSIKSTLREELSNLNLIEEHDNIDSMIENKMNCRIVSCGHYFHNKCFCEGYAKGNSNQFTCPLCLKEQNILIPPLSLFHDRYDFINSNNIKDLFNEEKINEKNEANDKIKNLFDTTVLNYLLQTNLFITDFKNSIEFLDEILPYYKSHMNYFENIFYIQGTTFHKKQQIDNMKNLILSLRLFLYDREDFNKIEIIQYIKETLLNLSKGPEENKFMYENSDTYMHYTNLLEKINLALILLCDYEEFKEMIKYILYIFLPYFCFGLFFKKLIVNKNNNELDNEQFKQKLNILEFKKYLKDDNETIMKKLNAFFKKLCSIKIISDYRNKIEENENIINTFNQQSMKDILSFLDLNNIINSLTQNEIFVEDIINELPKTFNSNDILYNLLIPTLNFDKVINNIFENVTKYNNNIKYEITKELILQFLPTKFNFIHFEKNIFDFLIKNTGKKCEICNKISRSWLLCLICGKKICDSRQEAFRHTDDCMGGYCIYIDMSNMILFYVDTKDLVLGLYPLYLDKNGIGPKKSKIFNEYNLSNERLKTTLENFINLEFHFK